MKLALIATYGNPLALGLRCISAVLKQHGHEVRMIFPCSARIRTQSDFSPWLLEALAGLARDADLIGMSLMTNTFRSACALTESLRGAGIRAPIVWGGVHPTLAPEESLRVADIVCLGEGEYPMLELADTLQAGKDPTHIESLWFRTNGTVRRNPVRCLADDLDVRPFPDYDLTDRQFIAHRESFVPATPQRLRAVLNRYRIQSARGCPYSCSFCNNAAMRQLYAGRGPWVRLRSNRNVISELEERIARFPMIRSVNIVDDLFFIRSETDLEEFVRLYRQRINLPIQLDAHPMTLTPQKIEIVRQLPLELVSMGIQSGSPDTLSNLYNRRTPIPRIVEAINLLADNRIPAEYHYLVNNPFEPEANFIETLRFAARHHRPPAIVRVFPLALYPGTPLHDRAIADGTIHGRHNIVYEWTYSSRVYILHDAYLTILLRTVLALKALGIPARIVEALVNLAVSPPLRWVLDRRWFNYLAFGLYRIGHLVNRRIVQQCILKPIAWLRRRKSPPRIMELSLTS